MLELSIKSEASGYHPLAIVVANPATRTEFWEYIATTDTTFHYKVASSCPLSKFLTNKLGYEVLVGNSIYGKNIVGIEPPYWMVEFMLLVDSSEFFYNYMGPLDNSGHRSYSSKSLRQFLQSRRS